MQRILSTKMPMFHVKHGGVGWFAGWLFESVVSPLWVARDWSGSFNCVFHVKHQSSQQLVREGRRTQKPSPTIQPPTHHVSRETIAITKSRRESWKSPFGKHNSPFPTIPTISVSRETSIDLSSCHTHRSLKIPQTHPNKLSQFQHPHVSRETPSLSNQ